MTIMETIDTETTSMETTDYSFMKNYNFNAAEAYETIDKNWTMWAKDVHAQKFVIGISGGKDSTVAAWLATKIFGRENVIGVLMPNGLPQADNDDTRLSECICSVLGIKTIYIDINKAFISIAEQAFNEFFDIDTKEADCEAEYACSPARINLAPRLRMAALFCVAQQCKNAVVICTDNLSESVLGYSTFGGDGFGCYAPLKNLTVTEVKKLAEFIGVPEFLYAKTPSDGLQDKTDEERFGFTYAAVDKCIRTYSDNEPSEMHLLRQRIIKYFYLKNKFKTDIVNVPGPAFPYPNFIKNM